MVKISYIPDRGDIAWVNFSPRRGREQKGQRPALVLTVKYYNERSGLALVCPITSKKKGYPFEVGFVAKKIEGVVLADQIISIDWKKRNAKFAECIESRVLTEVQEKIAVLLGDAY